MRTSSASALRCMIWTVAIASLTACAGRPDADSLSTAQEISEAHREVAIITVTDRQPDDAGVGYTAKRSTRLHFERFTLAVPVTRQLSVTVPHTRASSRETYPVTKREIITSINRSKYEEFLIYVHGYNDSFQESLFRFTGVVADGYIREVPILFSWPSEGSVAGYIADRDAATYARDDLVEFLAYLKAQYPDVNITLFGHSMGAWLVVEALRQLRLSDRDDVLHRIGQVVLASPDIEIDLFRRQVEAIGQLARPILVLTSTDDRALTVSRLFGGSRMRMGSVGEDSPAARRMIERKAIQIVDLTMLPASDSMKHNRFIRLAEILSKSEDKIGALSQNGMVNLIHNFDSFDLYIN